MAVKDAEVAAMEGEVMVAAKAATVVVGWEGVETVAVAQVAAVEMAVKAVAEAMMVAKGVRVAVVATMEMETRNEPSLRHKPHLGTCRHPQR